MAKTISQIFDQYKFLIGAIFGWLFARFWEEIRRPKLRFEIGEDGFWPSKAAPQTKFLHIKVINQKRSLLVALFQSNPVANNSRAWVSFLDFPSKKEILKINGRWTTKREPIDYKTGQVDLAEVLIPPRETIPPREEANISVGLKDDGQDNFFAFNNESYLHAWRNPDFELDEKRYIVRVKISTEGKEYIKDFVLLNPGKSIKNFKLTTL